MSDRTDIVIILDRSGSMQSRKDDHEGGLRSFIRDQRQLAGEVRVTLVRFDTADPCEIAMAERLVGEVQDDDLILVPRGGTPLLDAVGETLTKFAHLTGRVICMVITDGQENDSRTWKKAAVQDLVTSRTAVGWTVLYLGANVDEFAEAGGIGVGAQHAAGYADSPRGTQTMYRTASEKLLQARAVAPGASAGIMAFTAEERAHLKAEDKGDETP